MTEPVPPRRRRSFRRAAILAAAGAAALPAAALAVPTISGSEGSPINPALQSPDFTLSSPDPALWWHVTDGDGIQVDFAFGSSVDLGPLAEGPYTLWAHDEDGDSARAFVVDTTAPAAPVVSTPSSGAEYTVGQNVSASYTCDAGASCSPPDGSAVDTSSPGSKLFSVTAVDAAGNVSATSVSYTVVDPPPVDQAGPSISITTPAAGGTYALGATKIANYGCSDAESGIATCVGTVADGAAINTATVGTKSFTVTATDNAGNASAKTVTYTVVDNAEPTVSIASPNAGKYEINSLNLASYSCDDNAPGVVCAGTVPSGNPIDTSDLGNKTFTVQATDASGNTTTKQITYEVVDTNDPTPAGLVSPPDNTVTNQLRPKLNWTAATDPGPGGAPGSGIAGYEVMLDGKLVATVGAATTSFTPGEDLKTGLHLWRVRALDKAGNVALSDLYDFRVDPDATPAPTITGAPAAATNDSTPTFGWTGHPAAQEFRWSVKQGTTTVAAGAVGGATSSITPGPLADGAYVFTVTQRTNGDHGTAAAHAFAVDTVAPQRPTIVVRPEGASTDTTPLFGWAGGEADARYLWQLSGPGGVIVQGPVETRVNAALLTVAPGAYVFQVRQMDAAGNPSPLTIPEPFTVIGGEVVPPPPPLPGGADTTPQEPTTKPPDVPIKTVKQDRATPATRNVRAMTPRAGAAITSLRPVLRWKARKGATLYNVQVFRLKGVKLTKVVTAFPRGVSYKVPRGKLKAGNRYVWRVWPYVNRTFPRQPLGVSYFDVRQTAKSLARSRLLAPGSTALIAGRPVTVRWRAKSGSFFYKVQLLRGAKVVFDEVSEDRDLVVPAGAVGAKGAYTLRVRAGVGSSDTIFAAAPWAQATVSIR